MNNLDLSHELRSTVERSATPVTAVEARLRANTSMRQSADVRTWATWVPRTPVLVGAASLLVVAAVLVAVVGLRGSPNGPTSRFAVTLMASSSNSFPTPPRDEVSSNGSGWALTTKGLEITSNGGASFALVSTPVPVNTIGDVAAGGSSIVLAGWKDFAPWVQYSSDNGATWTTATLPAGSGNAGGVRLVTENGTVVGMLVTDVTSSNFSAGEWYATSDGGRTWTYDAAPSGGTVTSSNGKLWLVGGPQSNLLYKSTDAGSSWSKVSIPQTVIADGAALTVPGALSNGDVVLVAVTPSSNAGSTFGLVVYLSDDQGATWNLKASTSYPGLIGSDVSAISSNVVWIGTSSGRPRLFRYTDGGGLKPTNSVGLYQEGSVSEVSALSGSSAWATVQNGACPSGKSSCMEVGSLLATSDGGQTWSQVNLTPA
ncbi:MAG TPA: sialidase family protein [Acidimicrobiales bacterium]|nr:sialidase family protein [Acidimicrobiales bacterium]